MGADNILVSIITVSLNAVSTIERTIQSVLNQTYPSIEYIIIDGQSTDGTMEIVDKYKNRIDKIICEKDDGLYYAMNKGINIAKGEIVGIINSDDYYDPNAVQNIVDCYKCSNADVIYGNLRKIDSNGNESFIIDPKLEDMWYCMVVPHPTVFVNSRVYRTQGGFSLKYSYAADYELLLRFMANKIHFEYLPKTIATFTAGGLSETGILASGREAYEIALAYVDWSPDAKVYKKKIRGYWAYRKLMHSAEPKLSLGTDYKKIKDENIAVFGAGKIGRKLVEALDYHGIRKITVVDNNKEKMGNRILDYQIMSTDTLAYFDGIVVIAVAKDEGIKNQLTSLVGECVKVYSIMDFLEYILGDSDKDE